RDGAAIAVDRDIERPVEALEELGESLIDEPAGEPADNAANREQDGTQHAQLLGARVIAMLAVPHLDAESRADEPGEINHRNQPENNDDAKLRQRLRMSVRFLTVVLLGVAVPFEHQR